MNTAAQLNVPVFDAFLWTKHLKAKLKMLPMTATRAKIHKKTL